MMYKRYSILPFINTEDYLIKYNDDGLNEYKSYHRNGGIDEIFFLDSSRTIQKKYIKHYLSGTIFLDIDVTNGVANGLYKEYDIYGKLMIIGNVKEGMQHGLFQHFNRDIKLFYHNDNVVNVDEYGFDVNNLSEYEIQTLYILLGM